MIREQKQRIKLNPKQKQFCNSPARYPAFVGSWGCGKTLCGLLKGLQLSEAYPGNLGLVVRRNFTDLHDSTMKDFESYTGLTINQQHKEVTLSNGSVIMFRHGDELSTLQNINLGWFVIEQAEEFETDESFQMLRGRLRREGPAVLKGMVIANTNGHNWIWHGWKRLNIKRDSDFELTEANIDDNRLHIRSDTLADWAKLEADKPRIYRQFILNSWDDYGTDALFFGEQMSLARREHRIRPGVVYDKTVKVHRAWDVGTVHTAVLFFQVIKGKIRVIEEYIQDDPALDLTHAIAAVQKHNYVFGEDFVGPDIAKGAVNGKGMMGQVVIDEAAKLGVDFITVPAHNVVDGIECVRTVFNLLEVNEETCAGSILAWDNYKRMPKPSLSTSDRKEYADKAVHDWASHPSDALRYLAMAYRYLGIDEQPSQYTGEVSNNQPQTSYNPLSLSRL